MKIEHWEVLLLPGVRKHAWKNSFELKLTEKSTVRFRFESGNIDVELWMDELAVYTNNYWLFGGALSRESLKPFLELAHGLLGEELVTRLARRDKDDQLYRELMRVESLS